MKHAPLVLLFLATLAHADTASSVAVSDVTATKMPSTTSTTRRSLLIENRGANAIYCSPNSTVTIELSFRLGPGAWRSFPGTVVWCIAETAAQTGVGTDRTMVWESDS